MKTLSELVRHSALSIVFYIAPRFANVLMFILVGRLAGPAQAGNFSLATTYLLILTVALSGLDDLLIRQVARERESASRYLTNFLAVRLVSSIGLYIGFMIIIQRVLNYPAAVTAPIAILTFSVVPDSVALVAQGVLLGQRQFGPPAAILGAANGLKFVAGAAVLLGGGGLIEISWIWLIGNTVSMSVLLALAIRSVGGIRRSDWHSFGLLKKHRRAILAFSAATMLITIDSQTDTVLLSILRNEAQVGWYGAATTIAFGVLIFAQAYRMAVYPLMTRYAAESPDRLSGLFHKSIHYMSVLVVPVVVGLIVFASPLVELVFGPAFRPTAMILQVLAISLLFFFMVEPCNRLMLVKDRQKVIVKFLSVSATANVLLNLLLIPAYGAVGSALARTTSACLFFTLNIIYISRFIYPGNKATNIIRPMVAGLAMLMVTELIMPLSFLGSIILGVFVYVAILWRTGAIMGEDLSMLRRFLSGKSRDQSTGTT